MGQIFLGQTLEGKLQWQAQFSPQPLAASYHFRYLHFDVSEGNTALTFCEELSTP
jgi:hypothetical protein